MTVGLRYAQPTLLRMRPPQRQRSDLCLERRILLTSGQQDGSRPVPLPGRRSQNHRRSTPSGESLAGADDETMLLNTGEGLIYPEAIEVDVPVETRPH